MGTEKLADFYDDPRKLATDLQALHRALYQRRAVTEPSLRWRIHRSFLKLRRRLFSAIRSGTAEKRNLPGAVTGEQSLSIPRGKPG
jgi:hypothetical protein